MYSTRGHQLVVNEYHNECLRKAKEAEAERDAHHGRDYSHEHDPAVPPLPERPSPAGPSAI